MPDKIILIWDLDGTLISADKVSRLSMEMAFSRLHSIPNALDGYSLAGKTDTLIFEELCEKHSLDLSDIHRLIPEYVKAFESNMRDADSIRILPGVRELLDTLLVRHDVTNLMCTGNIEPIARLKMRPQCLAKYFTLFGFSIDEPSKLEIVKKAVANLVTETTLDFTNQKLCMIGDTPYDIICGKELGFQTVAVATGIYSAEMLAPYAPDHLLDNLYDYKNIYKILI